MVSLNSAEVNFIAYGWDEDNKAAMSLRFFFAESCRLFAKNLEVKKKLRIFA